MRPPVSRRATRRARAPLARAGEYAQAYERSTSTGPKSAFTARRSAPAIVTGRLALGVRRPLRGGQRSALGTRYSALNAQCSMLNAQCSVLSAQCSVLSAQCSVLSAQCSGLSARRSALGARRSALDARYATLGARCSLLLARRWVLGTQRSQLTVRCPLLEARCHGAWHSVPGSWWPRVVARRRAPAAWLRGMSSEFERPQRRLVSCSCEPSPAPRASGARSAISHRARNARLMRRIGLLVAASG
jgi:hypothetical protein